MQRTDWAEIILEHFSARPLTAECVFRSPKYLPEHKELCDHILLLRNTGIIVSLKCQEDPSRRTGQKLEAWVKKAAQKGVSQAQGALRSVAERQFYCNHSRRGRVDFQPGSINVKHLVVVLETSESVLLGEEFPLYHQNVPITYLSTNDFLNLLDELRAFPDIEGYFDARRCLPEESLRCVGSERHLFEYYLIREQSFVGCQGVEYVNESVAENKHELTAAIERKCEADNYARIVEHVSDALADRHAEYNEGLEEKLLSRFDDPTNRQNSLVMQEELCELQLSDRRLVGYQFEQVIRKVQEDDHSESMAYAAIWADAKPDFLYVLVSAKGISRPVLLERCTVLLSGALAFYGKPSGIVVADRDGASYEIQLIANQEQSAQSKEVGQQFFQNLEMSAYPSTFSPS